MPDVTLLHDDAAAGDPNAVAALLPVVYEELGKLAAVRLADAGYDGAQVEEIFNLLPAATHNQRAEATLMIGTKREVDARDLIGIAENAMSAPVFELLKRPDELYVVEHAHLHPRFVEDSVRLMVAGTQGLGKWNQRVVVLGFQRRGDRVDRAPRRIVVAVRQT